MEGNGWPALRVASVLILALFLMPVVHGARPADAAVIEVTTAEDELNVDGDCSLREAIEAANAATKYDECDPGTGEVIITLQSGVYPVVITGYEGSSEAANAVGDLDIEADVTISGAGIGPGLTATTIAAAGGHRVFQIGTWTSSPHPVVTIEDVVIAGGSGPLDGGGVANHGTLSLERSIVRNNSVSGEGGGIWSGGELTVRDTTIRDNTAALAGGLEDMFGVVTLENVTVNGNTSTYQGGGILNEGGGALTVVNTTVSGNTSLAGVGGGLWNWYDASAALSNATVVNNTGGGIYNHVQGGVSARNSIVADNSSGADCEGVPVISEWSNLDSDGTCFGGEGTDLQLGSLRDNGGLTWTHALLRMSPQEANPAVDGGECGVPPVPAEDQRGVSRADGNDDGTSECDVGAFECPGFTTKWEVLDGDRDCDGFADLNERYMGTDEGTACPGTSAANDEDPDAWPPDFDDNQWVNILDIVQLTPPVLGSCLGDPLYAARMDLNADGCINMLDIVIVQGFFNMTCA